MTSLKIVSRRAQVLLGTFVSIHFLDHTADSEFYDDLSTLAFGEIRRIGEMMSFHSATSELTRLNGAPLGRDIPISRELHEVLSFGLELNDKSDGAYNFAIGKTLSAGGILPSPKLLDQLGHCGAIASSSCLAGQHFSSPVLVLKVATARRVKDVWIDLGGIAKGFAVDRAVACIRSAFPKAQGCVNAGGDLVVFGQTSQCVALGSAEAPVSPTKVSVCNAAVATTQIHSQAGFKGYVNPHSGQLVSDGPTLTVVAPTCMVADALTKVAHFASPELFKTIARKYHADVHVQS